MLQKARQAVGGRKKAFHCACDGGERVERGKIIFPLFAFHRPTHDRNQTWSRKLLNYDSLWFSLASTLKSHTSRFFWVRKIRGEGNEVVGGFLGNHQRKLKRKFAELSAKVTTEIVC
jgi:hypothetical protein